MSHSGAVSTASDEPSLIAFTNISPRSISTIACSGIPASMICAAPLIRLVSPEVMAENCSTACSGMPADRASGTPSAVTTIACAMSATRRVKSVTSQFRSSR